MATWSLAFPPNQGYKTITNKDLSVFLAGPIQGAPNWQKVASTWLTDRSMHQLDAHIVVCNPRTPEPWHGDYEGQVDWETHHLQRAASRGVILFWLAKEDEASSDPSYGPPGRTYGQTTRFELGEWFGIKKTEYLRWQIREHSIVVGIEPGFTNERYLRRRLSQQWPNMQIPPTIEETCDLALVELCKVRNLDAETV